MDEERERERERNGETGRSETEGGEKKTKKLET